MAILQRGDGSARGGHSIGIGGKRATFSRATLAAVLTSTSLGVLSLAMPAVAQVRAESVTFDIPSQPINEALVAFARQASVRLVMPDAQFGSMRSNAVRGTYDREAALAQLLRGTGVAARLENGAIVLQRSADATRATQPAAPNAREEPFQLALATPQRTTATDATAGGRGRASDETDEDADTVVIVGTNIRGVYPSSSPVEIFTAEDIARTGATTTEQFIQKLPQNLGTRAGYGAGTGNSVSTVNRDSINGIDLRGLGLGTTLTLVNGRRIGLSDFGQTADVSLIPVAAIERVEVLTDGASAIYGSDAIGGVVNFVLRDDFEGAETRLSYGGVTDGNLRQGDFSQTIGGHWTGGRAVAGYAYHSASALERDDRDYAAPAGPGDLTPDEIRQNVFLALSQDLTDRLTLDGNLAFARRKIKNEYTTFFPGFPSFDSIARYHSQTDQWFANAALDYQLTSTLNASIQASYSREYADRDSRSTFYNLTPPFSSVAILDSQHSALDIAAKLDGALFALPGGAVRFSVGAGLLDESYSGASAVGFSIGANLDRRTTYSFGEIFAPLIGEAQGVPFVRRLELSLAGRYTGYDDTSSPSVSQDFGDSTDPKIGLLWAPFEELNFRGTYGTSYRAPALTQVDPTSAAAGLNLIPVAGQPASVLSLGGFPAAELEPETAKTYTVGFDFRPRSRPSFRLSATYYNISYDDRIAQAPGSSAADKFVNPQLYPDAIYRATSAAQVAEMLGNTMVGPAILAALPGVDPSDLNAVAAGLFALPNFWISDSRLRNLALSEQDGLDFSVRDDFETPAGDLALGATITHIFIYRQQSAPTFPTISVVDSVNRPPDLRGRAFATLSRGGFVGSLGVNYTDDYFDPANARSVDEWTTIDLVLAYNFENALRGALDGFRLNLSFQNLFDEDPPFVNVPGRNQVGFDTANANPLGRLVVLSVTKAW